MDAKLKATIFRALKVISYCAGFPLMLLFIWKDTLTLGLSNDGLNLAIWMWVILVAAQIGVAFIFKGDKKRDTRMIIVIVVALLVTLLPALVIDSVWKSKLEKIAEEQSQYGVGVVNYNHAVSDYNAYTTGGSQNAKDLSGSLSNFKNIYNIGDDGSNKGRNFDDVDSKYNEETGEYLKPNGMWGDGFVPGVDQALDVLITVYETRNKYANYATLYEEELAKAKASQAYLAYIATAEYKANLAESLNYFVHKDKLNAILAVLGAKLDEVEVLPLILTFFKGTVIGDKTLEQIFKEADGVAEDADYDMMSFFDDLTVEKLGSLLPMLNGLLGTELTIDSLFDLLGGYSWYESSNNKPIYDFFEDTEEGRDMAAYGKAYYYATKHGALVDSVLINEADGGKIGKSSDLDDTGYPASFGYSLHSCYQLRADMTYKNELYPMVSARRYLITFAGIAAIALFLAYFFASKEKKFAEEI